MNLFSKIGATDSASDAGCSRASTHTHRKSRFWRSSLWRKTLAVMVFTSILMGGGIAKGQISYLNGGMLTPNDSCIFQTDDYNGDQIVWYYFVSNSTNFELTVQEHVQTKIPATVFEGVYIYDINYNQVASFSETTENWTESFTVPTIGDTFLIKLESSYPPSWYDFDICLTKGCVPDVLQNNIEICEDDNQICVDVRPCIAGDYIHLLQNNNVLQSLPVVPNTTYYNYCFNNPNTTVGTYFYDICVYSSTTGTEEYCEPLTVTVLPPPTTEIIEGNVTICPCQFCFHDTTTDAYEVDWDLYFDYPGVGWVDENHYYNNPPNDDYCYNFSTPGNYQLIATATGECGTDYDTIYITVVPASADFTWEGICVNSDICFTELATCEEFWHWDFGDGSTSTLQNPCHTYTSAGTYQVTLIIDQAGTSITYPVVIVDPIQPVITGDEYACDILGHYNVSPAGAFTQIGWAVNNPTGWIATVPPDEFTTGWPNNTGGIVYVQTTDINGCVAEGEFMVFDCCVNPETTISFFNETLTSPQTYWHEVISVNGTLTIDANGTTSFYDCHFYMGVNAKIVITSNDTVNIGYHTKNAPQTIIEACDSLMWDGIYINDNTASLYVYYSKIYDAKNAVVSLQGGYYDILTSLFDKNHYHLVVRPYNGIHNGSIQANTFTCSGTLLPQYPPMPSVTKTRFAISAYRVNGIQFGNPQSPQMKNTIENCDVGIYCLNSAVEVYNNDFQDISVPLNMPISEKKGFGVFAEKQLQIGAPVSSLIVGGSGNLPGSPHFKPNTFTDVTNGVYTYQYQNIDIKNNDFELQNSSGLASNAIQIDEFVHFQGTKRIEFNNIEKYRTGIKLNNVENIYVENNDISNFYISPYGGLSYGIHVLGGSYAYVLSNDIENAFISDRTKGITVSTSPSSVVQCNIIKNMGTSIHLQGTMLPFTLRQNRMQDGIDALVFSYATIGTQGTATNPQGNTWYGNFSGCQTLMDGSYGNNSEFYCKTGYHTFPTNNCALQQGTNFVSIPTNSNSWPGCMQVIPVAPSTASLYSIANDQIGFGQYEQENKWLARKQALLKIDRESLSGDPLLDQFTLSQQNTGTAITQTIEDTLPVSFNDAQIINLSLNTQLYNEIARKTVNSAFFLKESDTLTYPTQFIVNTTLLDSLKWVAQQCPYEFGEAVYQARMFLAMIDTTKYINECEIEYSGTPDKSAITLQDDTNNIAVWPNPFGDEINIVFSNPSETVCYATILDLTGKTIFTFEIPEKTNTYLIPAERMANGVYYLKIWNTCQILKYSKIVKY